MKKYLAFTIINIIIVLVHIFVLNTKVAHLKATEDFDHITVKRLSVTGGIIIKNDQLTTRIFPGYVFIDDGRYNTSLTWKEIAFSEQFKNSKGPRLEHRLFMGLESNGGHVTVSNKNGDVVLGMICDTDLEGQIYLYNKDGSGGIQIKREGAKEVK